jgi:methylmalonyl-CoA/ethylmalonyl-CoA epimerase
VKLPLDHIAIAVPSIAGALPIFELITGARGSSTEIVESQGVSVSFIGAGTGKLELIEPTAPDSAVARFLEQRGPALHHIAFQVTDLQRTLDRLAAAGIELIDSSPRVGAGGHAVAFLNPRSTNAILIELVEK